ncbi:hypothetical protein OIO90_004269 [Microbotryomycetes sp. JL221]|nr:hypothetical protein OIO90_004269 [Microbotryomycetes sp. JL221]
MLPSSPSMPPRSTTEDLHSPLLSPGVTSETSSSPWFNPTTMVNGNAVGTRPASGSSASTATSATTTTRMYPIRTVMYPSTSSNSVNQQQQQQHSSSTNSQQQTRSSSTRPGTGSRTYTNTSNSSLGTKLNTTQQSATLSPVTPLDSCNPNHHGITTTTELTEQSLQSFSDGHQNPLTKQTVTNHSMTRGPNSSTNTNILMTRRFEHEVGSDGENFIITGRNGVILRCEDEEIHAPGAVQAYGVMIVAQQESGGKFPIYQVSENSKFILGLPPNYLFSIDCLSKVLNPGEIEILEETLEACDERNKDPHNLETGPLTITLSGFGLPGTDTSSDAHSTDRLEWTCHAAIHRPDPANQPNRFVLELELVEDQVNPLTTETEDVLPGERGGISEHGMDPTQEELIDSTVSIIKPLRALTRVKRSRRSRKGQTNVDVVALLSQVTDQLNKTDDLNVFLKIVACIFKEVTQFDRCMVYQFDDEWNGRVVSEQVDWTRTHDLYLGLNFPASDIPPQAREMYRINQVRLLYDRDQPTARMCCRNLKEVENPLDMTHCHLRAMSPIHIKYLGNMGVRASMSISITAFGDLWGLVACHSYGKFGHRVSFPVRQFCKLLGSTVSRNIERLSYAKRLNSRRLIHTAPSETNPSGYIVAKGEDLLVLFDADFGVLSIGDEAKIIGPVSNSQELLAVLEYLRQKRYPNMMWTQDIRKDWDDIDYPTPFQMIAGALCVPLSGSGSDFITFFRKGQLQEVKWAGNPYANKTVALAEDGKIGLLEPRKSFRIWSETVLGRCRAWTDEQLETGGALALVYGKFIAVWREQREALAQRQMSAILLANASNEVRTPLNAIVNYLEQALDSEVSNEVRDNLMRSHAASRSLIHVINDLLDLTRTEEGRELFLQDPFNLPTTINEALSVHKTEANRRGLTLEVVENPTGTPRTLLGDRGKIKTIITSVINNAVKHTKEGGILVEWGELADADVEDALDKRQDSIRIGISITDTGVGMSEAKLESIFREFEQVSATSDDTERSESAVGLGLALVARIIRNLGGQLRVESNLGQGSKFTFVLPFRLPSQEDFKRLLLLQDNSMSSSGDSSKTLTGTNQSLVTSTTGSTWNGYDQHAIVTNGRTSRSLSIASAASLESGSKGSIEDLIEAMSSNLGPKQMTRKSSGSTGSGHNGGQRIVGGTTLGHSLSGIGKTSPQSSPTTDRRRIMSVSSERGQGGELLIDQSSVPLRAVKVEDLQAVVSSTDACSRRSSVGASNVAIAVNGQTTEQVETNLLQSGSPRLSMQNTERPLLQTRRDSPTHVSEFRRASLEGGGVATIEDKIPPMRVLVVEDELVNRLMIRKRLQKDGHDVVVVEHGGDAVRLLEKDQDFDLVLMDLLMPIMGGLEATQRIRCRELLNPPASTDVRPSTMLNGRLPIFAFSASLPERERLTIVEAGFDGWLLKPLDFKRLKCLMKSTRDSRERSKNVYEQGYKWEKGGFLENAVSVRLPAPKKFPGIDSPVLGEQGRLGQEERRLASVAARHDSSVNSNDTPLEERDITDDDVHPKEHDSVDQTSTTISTTNKPNLINESISNSTVPNQRVRSNLSTLKPSIPQHVKYNKRYSSIAGVEPKNSSRPSTSKSRRSTLSIKSKPNLNSQPSIQSNDRQPPTVFQLGAVLPNVSRTNSRQSSTLFHRNKTNSIQRRTNEDDDDENDDIELTTTTPEEERDDPFDLLARRRGISELVESSDLHHQVERSRQEQWSDQDTRPTDSANERDQQVDNDKHMSNHVDSDSSADDDNHQNTSTVDDNPNAQIGGPMPETKQEWNQHQQENIELVVPDYIKNNLSSLRYSLREPLAEFIGMIVLVCIGISSDCQVKISKQNAGDFSSMNFSWGIGVMAGIYISGGISGGHLNPSLTIALAFFRGFPWRMVPRYVFAQILGAFCGALIVWGNYKVALNNYDMNKNIYVGLTQNATAPLFVTVPNISAGGTSAGFFQELIATAILAIVVLALGDENNAPPGAGLGAAVLGLVITAIGMSMGYLSGYAINPARDFGARLALWTIGFGTKLWTHDSCWWIIGPICGPIVGALIGCLIYDVAIFQGSGSPVNSSWYEIKHGLRIPTIHNMVRIKFVSKTGRPMKNDVESQTLHDLGGHGDVARLQAKQEANLEVEQKLKRRRLMKQQQEQDHLNVQRRWKFAKRKVERDERNERDETRDRVNELVRQRLHS